MIQILNRFVKTFFVLGIIRTPIYAEAEVTSASDYKGNLTCENLDHFRVYTNDPRFVPFCSDASKGCFIREQLHKLPETHPLRAELDTKLVNHLTFNFALCEVAILTFEPKIYKDEFGR